MFTWVIIAGISVKHLEISDIRRITFLSSTHKIGHLRGMLGEKQTGNSMNLIETLSNELVKQVFLNYFQTFFCQNKAITACFFVYFLIVECSLAQGSFEILFQTQTLT